MLEMFYEVKYKQLIHPEDNQPHILRRFPTWGWRYMTEFEKSFKNNISYASLFS